MKRLAKIFKIIGIILIILAFSIYIYSIYINKKAYKKSNEILEIINEKIEEQEEIVEDKIIIDNEEYLGIITIPKISIVLPINREWSYTNLNNSPCVYYGSIEENNLVICAHNYKSQFGYLDNLLEGDQIIITTTNDNYIYEVVDKIVVNPFASEEVIETEYDLTLFSCFREGLERIIIHAKKINNY